MVIGVLIGNQLGNNLGYEEFAEIISVITGILFLIFSYILLGFYDRKRKRRQREESTVKMKKLLIQKKDSEPS